MLVPISFTLNQKVKLVIANDITKQMQHITTIEARIKSQRHCLDTLSCR
jgi:hypothetical protein